MKKVIILKEKGCDEYYAYDAQHIERETNEKSGDGIDESINKTMPFINR
jgi:hypothetical protein